ncbi:hypothetical protein CONCODRAFT_17856 [Conidiobolus coronatus NRRL 28638]|uniref:Uncharacterized protein n=1 Tax=Conidiobolus coronatus (strain ATCC 28846 / CBS 209.66 / NRRL 28638) TaxID=796925 RepID=A0A137P510_CONC2|nr:hypothetical protein CONCODRAFT_17856 [Conidiobolus coronatus NRRL 28638]|eukprot:KXN70095.1 hypothetical protein CONCODRAFT_17856 [Conidiobolus coronatus NRRL 28638]
MYRKLSDKRRKIEEEEEMGDSSESESEQEQEQETKKRILPIDARATNKWNERITKLMNIKVYDEMIFDIEKDREDDNNPLYFNIITDDMWRGYIDVGGLSVNRELKTLVAEVKKMYDKASKSLEYFVDTYVSPLSVGLKHELEVEIGINQERITSIPDFVVRSFESNMIVIVEDKT